MFYPNLTDNLNLATLAIFAEPFTLNTVSGPVSLEGIPDYRTRPEGVSHVGFNDRMLTLAVTQAIFDTNLIALTSKSGQTITFRSKDYKIIEIQDDLGDMVELTIRSY